MIFQKAPYPAIDIAVQIDMVRGPQAASDIQSPEARSSQGRQAPPNGRRQPVPIKGLQPPLPFPDGGQVPVAFKLIVEQIVDGH